MVKKIYDIVIIGAGPAGLTAAIYAGRKKLSVLVVAKQLGGQAATASLMENYPGFDKVQGPEFVMILEKQAKKYGAEIIFDEIISIKKENKEIKGKEKGGETKENKEIFVLKGKQEYKAKSVILAFGKTPRSLNIENERQFTGKGVSYCSTCDAPLFKDKIVAVVGGGNSAFESALLLSKIAKKVYLIHRREEFRADEIIIEKIKKLKNVELMLNVIIEKFQGKEFLESAEIKNTKTNKTEKIKLDGCFIEIGSDVKTDFVKKLVKTDEFNQIIINNKNETSQEGVFAAGDVTNVPFKQAIISAGEGAKAAMQAYNYLKGIKPRFSLDWK